MNPVCLDPLITVNVEDSPFGRTDLSEFPWQARYNSLKNAYQREMYAIRVEDEAVGAMLLQVNGSPELIFFEVEPRWRGKGVGHASLEILFERLRRKSFDNLIVQTGRPEIYSGMGFQFKIIDQGHIEIDLNCPRAEAVVDPQATASFVYSAKYLIYDYPDHPEHDGRVEYTMTRLRKEGLLKGANVFTPRLATEEEILQLHSRELLEQIKSCSRDNRPVARDTPASADTYELARLSLGGALSAADLIDDHRQVFVLCRPPGHHAGRDQAGGFCFFNNMALLALRLWKKGLNPMIVDWDAHHGNGTQDLLYEHPIMYVSLHQKYLYPHTGAESETGEGAGKNFTRNFPLPIGMRDEEYLKVFGEVRSIAKDLRPDIMLISAGQDAHYLDKLSGLKLTSDAYYKMGLTVGEVARQYCDGRIILLLEGGYHLQANAESLSLAIKGIKEACE